MVATFLIALVLLAICLALLAINILLKKNGKFRSEDVGANRAMQERGIHCTRTQDRLAQADKSSIYDMMK